MQSKTILLTTNRTVLPKLFKDKIVSLTKLPTGVNSFVYKVKTVKNNVFLVKQYRKDNDGHQNRLLTEFKGLSFLWKNGIQEIPEPLALDTIHEVGVYQFIKGHKLTPKTITPADINQAADFLRKLHLLTRHPDAVKQPVAADACFTIDEYITVIENRVKTIAKSPDRALVNFIRLKFMPFFKILRTHVYKTAKQMRLDTSQKLSQYEKTLSPSDFGFHNIIKTSSNKLIFIDFEYYGWDDPAKMVCDFFLQPAIPVPMKYRKVFFGKICAFLENDIHFINRVALVYPLLSLKWCLIMINTSSTLDAASQIRQLTKARKQLVKTKQEFYRGVFPVHL